MCQISFLLTLPEIRFQEKGDCYVRYRSGNPEQWQQLTPCTLSLFPLPRGIKHNVDIKLYSSHSIPFYEVTPTGKQIN